MVRCCRASRRSPLHEQGRPKMLAIRPIPPWPLQRWCCVCWAWSRCSDVAGTRPAQPTGEPAKSNTRANHRPQGGCTAWRRCQGQPRGMGAKVAGPRVGALQPACLRVFAVASTAQWCSGLSAKPPTLGRNPDAWSSRGAAARAGLVNWRTVWSFVLSWDGCSRWLQGSGQKKHSSVRLAGCAVRVLLVRVEESSLRRRSGCRTESSAQLLVPSRYEYIDRCAVPRAIIRAASESPSP